MALSDELKSEVTKIFGEQWTARKGQVVPEPEDLKLSNYAVEFDRATVLYADLSGSTAMVNSRSWQLAAEVYKTFLHCAAKLIRQEGAKITSYDGDRIMGIFVGDMPCTSAAKCALKINYAVGQIINPALKAQYPKTDFAVKQVVGIDVSPIRAARIGVRGGNDIVWVGRAANYAAKLTALNLKERSWITKEAYDRLNDSAKFGGNPRQNMWKSYTWTKNGDHPYWSL